jgi:hypothetical protein
MAAPIDFYILFDRDNFNMLHEDNSNWISKVGQYQA